MATINTQYNLGNTIRFLDDNEIERKEVVKLIECQLVEGYGLWVRYGYGYLYEPQWVSEHKILKDQRHFQ